MALRFSCEPKYNDRWSRYHGTCICIGIGDEGGRVWDPPGSNAECRLHGPGVRHPYVWTKVIHARRR